MNSKTRLSWLVMVVLGAAVAATTGCDDGGGTNGRTLGQTDFETEDPQGGGRGTFGNGAVPASDSAGGTKTGAPTNAGAPSGRNATVEEADIYRIDGNRLFYFSTYQGFLVYDIADTKNPRRLSKLPVYGYPVEMFVTGTTVYALLRDVLYLTETNGQVRFQRHDVSQLVSIDVTDPANPRVLQTVDIVGQLREGVSRKIDDTIYVVSYVPQGYYWGWRYELTAPQQEQAWVYSFNVADPQNLVKVQELQIFEGGSVNDVDPVSGAQVSRYFSDVAISATSNALMVVENWYISSWTPGTTTPSGKYDCGTYSGDQRAVVSIIDVSDPTGVIRRHTRFQTRGALGDQFKQTYVYDDATATGTYYGIFTRQAWQSTSNCSGTSFVQNALESWDVTNGASPAKLSSLDFGKPNETVRGTAFDLTRKAAFAVTAQSIDPLYVFDLSDRAHLGIRSQIDGLSGDMTLFRQVEGGKFLIGIGRDASETCTGFQGSESRRGIGVAVSLIDVRDLDAIRLVQRQCVAVDGDWVSSEVTWNLDQAHKMIGMESDGTTNVITVPVSYAKRTADNDWWWYREETAVGIMAWDVSAYDPTKAPAAQTVIKNYGTFVHPNGTVRRSIVFPNAATARRTMINLSDTHVSIADIQDLANPILQSVIEVAPYIGQIYQLGTSYVVEQISTAPYGWSASQGVAEFRIKAAGGDLDGAPVVSTFSVPGVQSVVPFGADKLIMFRLEEQDPALKTSTQPSDPVTRVMVFDLSNPKAPRLAGSTTVPGYFYGYLPFFCGLDVGYWYWWGQGNSWTKTSDALVQLGWTWDSVTQLSGSKLTTIDLRDIAHPAVFETPLGTGANRSYGSLVADGADDRGFYLTYADVVGKRVVDGATFNRSRYYAERWSRTPAGSNWQGEGAVNLPGLLARTWRPAAGTRALLTTDTVNYLTTDDQGNKLWRYDTRLNLLRAVTSAGGAPVAELTAMRRFQDKYVSDFVTEGSTLFVNVGSGYYGYYNGGGVLVDGVASRGALTAAGGASALTARASALTPVTPDDASDRLMIFDVSQLAFDTLYDQPTGTSGAQLMGTYHHQLFVNLSGDGLFAVDVTDPSHPSSREFLRTLGWATNVAFAGDNAYVASGYFGTYHMALDPGLRLPAPPR